MILVQRTFEDGTSPAELAWMTMSLIPKGKGEYRGIGIVEVAWKVYTAAVNCWLKRGVVLQDALHGFRGVQGTWTATLEAKLAQQLVGPENDPLFKVFLDIRKEYDSLDRDQCIKIMRGYGMGPNLTCLLKSNWERQRISPRLVILLGRSFIRGGV